MQIVRKGDRIIYYRKKQVIDLCLVFGTLVAEAIYKIEQYSPGSGVSYVEAVFSIRNPKLDRQLMRDSRRTIRKLERKIRREKKLSSDGNEYFISIIDDEDGI